MLPVNILSSEEAAYFASHGVSEENILAAMKLDLDMSGNYGSTWLAIDMERRRLCRADIQRNLYNEYELEYLVSPYIDNYNTSNALLAFIVKEPVKILPDSDEKEYKERCETAAGSGMTEIVGFCTNACKLRLFAFVHIWEHFVVGDIVAEDDPIFEQFLAKCPKCGTVYEDQSRRICTHCANRKSLLRRLLEYFKPFKFQLAVVIICLLITAGITLVSPIVSGQLLYDQVIDVTDENVRAEYGELVDLTDNRSIFTQSWALIKSLASPKYYYYSEDSDGKYIFDSESRKYVTAEADSEETRYTLVLTDEKNENENAVRVTGRLHSKGYVYAAVWLIFGLAIASLAVEIVTNRCNATMSTSVTKTMRDDIFRAMSALSLSYFNKNPTGRLFNRVNYDAVRIKDFYIGGLPYLIINVIKFVGIVILLFSINVRLTLIVLIPVPLIFFLFKFMLPKLWRSYSQQWRASSSMNSMLGDVLNGERVVKAFAKEDAETNRFISYADRIYKANLRTNLIQILIFPVVSLLIGITSQAIWGFGGVSVMNGSMTYGQLVTYFGYLGMIFAPLDFFSTFTNMITDTINSAQRMFEVLDMIPEITESSSPVSVEKLKGNITFDKVCFHYSPNRPILNNVSFEIHEGDHVGLVGHTGSGKSTIANLVTRMYDVVSGSVSIDGVNVKDLTNESLRRNIAVVSQEVFIFGGTIADNIRYAKPDATMDEIIMAAKAANAHDFITRLPEGYETLVGIGSRSLSGGERQRISIARALLLSPSILILDEATAAMDNETERQISDAIDRLVVGRTTISIAHRLSTLKNCNYIMAIEHGELAEMGSAEELLEKKGVYYNLYTLQNDQMNQVMQGL